MKKQSHFHYGCMVVLALLGVGCSTSSAPEQFGETISLTWELKSNFALNGRTNNMEFTFTNNGTKTLTNEGWTLYFTQHNSGIVPSDSNEVATVEHINGYFYKLTPKPTFTLLPGESVKVNYYFTSNYAKVGDGPQKNLYFVFHEGTPKEKIVVIKNYSILPFVREEQYTNGPADRHPLMTPQLRYEKNQAITPLHVDQLPPIVPMPEQIKLQGGEVTLADDVSIQFTKEVKQEADYLVQFVKQHFNISIPATEVVSPESKAGVITLKCGDVSMKKNNPEAYTLAISPEKGISITGVGPAGVFYGIQSLIQLIPLHLFEGNQQPVTIPAMTVTDSPRFAYRGMAFDIARHFPELAKIKHVIDLLASYKINKLQLLVSDDEGWRLEIPDLPELTEVGSRRGHTIDGVDFLQPAFGSSPFPNDPSNYGDGYLTRSEYIELVRYASVRHVQIIPEVCFPSHARAAVVSMENRYRKYMKQGDEKKALEYRLKDPDDQSEYSSAQSFTDNVACMGMESTYTFYDKVIGEIVKMHEEAGTPLTFFHTGGDELPNGAWMKSPLCKPYLDALTTKVKNTTNLNTICFDRMRTILDKYNLTIGGWEEVAMHADEEGKKVPNPQFAGKNIVPFVWNNIFGDEDLGNRLANAGYPVVLCGVANLYLDMAYDKDPVEPGLVWGGFTTAWDAFYFAPYDVFKSATEGNRGKPYTDADFVNKERLRPDARKNVLGVQVQLWAETLLEPSRIEYFILPKLIGFSVTAWSPERTFETIENRESRLKEVAKQWNVMANVIGIRDMKRLDYLFGGYGYRIDPPGAVIRDGMLYVNNEYPGFTIRYTTDGTEPSLSSPLYTEPVAVKGVIKVKAFNAKGRESRTSELQQLECKE
ncbi:MAG: family 20 glycosylhydrolase [Bacteroidales bacterium]